MDVITDDILGLDLIHVSERDHRANVDKIYNTETTVKLLIKQV